MKILDILNEDFSPNWTVIEDIKLFNDLKETNQSSVWHKEGNVFNHTKLVAGSMLNVINGKVTFVKNETFTDEQKVALMAAAICHDLGKSTTTRWDDELKEWKCKNHGLEGERMTRILFFDEPNITLREKVCYMVRYHMALHHVYDVPSKTNERIMKLSFGPASLYEMVCLNYADSMGSINDEMTESELIDKLNTVMLSDMSGVLTHEDVYQSYYGFRRKIKENSPTVYVMVGVAGSGKSTWINNNIPNATIISRDIIREKLGYAKPGQKVKCSKKEESKVSEVFMEEAINTLSDGKDIVLDNMNITKRYRDAYHNDFIRFSPKYVYVYVEAPAIDDNIVRRKGQISENEIKRMFNSIEFPEHHEYDVLIFDKQYND